MNRDEKKIKTMDLIEQELLEDEKHTCGINLSILAEEILNAIDPPLIQIGMWGRFWDGNPTREGFMLGRLNDISEIEGEPRLYISGEAKDFLNFTPIPGLKEAIEKLEKE